MKTLTLVRHAKSSWKDPTLADHDRPLNKRGRRDATRMGKRFAAAAMRPGLLVSSPAVRARCTAEMIARELGYAADRIVLDDRLYENGVAGMLDAVRELDDSVDHAVVFGHNPTLTMAVNQLTGSDIDNVPTCGVAHIRLATDSWAAVGIAEAELIEFDYPKRVDD